MEEHGPPDKPESTVAGRRTLGPPPKPPSRYSLFVGLAFLALVIIAFVNMVTTRNPGTLGLDEERSDLPLPEFAVPAAASSLEGDANIAQDDCETSRLPCPHDSRRSASSKRISSMWISLTSFATSRSRFVLSAIFPTTSARRSCSNCSTTQTTAVSSATPP